MRIGDGPAELIVEHNTIIQTDNVLIVYGGSKDVPAVVERFVFRNNISRHNANGVIGQGLALGIDTLDAFFPGAVFRERRSPEAAPRVSGRQPVSRPRSLLSAVRELRRRTITG